VEGVVVNLLGTKATAVITNVMGPKEKLYLAGAPLEYFLFWVPQSGHLGLGISIQSYAGQIRVGIISDRGLAPDPGAILAGLEAELEVLAAEGGGEPA
jgi:hypothetical protein